MGQLLCSGLGVPLFSLQAVELREDSKAFLDNDPTHG
jgi:hypothetical protein